MAQFVLCVNVVIWSVLHVPAIGSRSMPRCMYGITILELLHVLGLCSCKMIPSVRAPLNKYELQSSSYRMLVDEGDYHA